MRVTVCDKHNRERHLIAAAQAAAWYYTWYRVQPPVPPTFLIHAQKNEMVDQSLGFCGISFATDEPLTTEWYIDHRDMADAFGSPVVNRRKLCELGSLVTKPGNHTDKRGRQKVVCALTATSLLAAHKSGKKYVILTGSNFMRLYARQLGVSLHDFGAPDLSRRSPAYRNLWQPYFERAERRCFGFLLEEAVDGCRTTLAALQKDGFLSEAVH